LISYQAGGIAGTTVDLSLFPLDTLKTRLQSGPNGFIQAGGFRGIYRGIGSALVGSAPGAALFFITYDSIKRYLLPFTQHYASKSKARDAALTHMLAASLGEIAACAVRVPTEVVKQRAQARQFNSSWASLRHILSSYGGTQLIRELYRGGGVTLLREVPFTIVQFPLWEALKARHSTFFPSYSTSNSGTIGAFPSAIYGSVAGAIAAGITTPLDVLKTRLMLSRERVGAVAMLQRIVHESGPRALFAGLGPRMAWISIGGAIFLGSYQWAYNTFSVDALTTREGPL
jgi:solute carrier family 25 S-adenosylmethionine transporter 26